jgi:hypothetical protein
LTRCCADGARDAAAHLPGALVGQAVSDGFTQIKLKVGGDADTYARRLALAREAVGPDVRIAVDANQRWNVKRAISAIQALAPYDPYWVEEPTSPDEILGLSAIREAVTPLKIAAGEHAANRVIFKQLLQAGALGFLNIDACRVAGVNENLAILLLAARRQRVDRSRAGAQLMKLMRVSEPGTERPAVLRDDGVAVHLTGVADFGLAFFADSGLDLVAGAVERAQDGYSGNMIFGVAHLIWYLSQYIARARELEAACEEFGVSLRAAAARFPLRHPAVASVLIGARSAAEISDAGRLRELDIPAALWDSMAVGLA